MKFKRTIMLRSFTFLGLCYFSKLCAADCDYDVFIDAIKAGDIDRVGSYISAGCDVKSPSESLLSALDLALILNKNEIFKRIVAADKSIVKTKGVNALVAACNTNIKNKEIIELLVKEGVDINTMSSNGYSCLYHAAVLPDVEFFKYLLNLGANPNAKIVPDPAYKVDHLMSVEQFIELRSQSDDILKEAMNRQMDVKNNLP